MLETAYEPHKILQTINGVQTLTASDLGKFRDDTTLWFWRTKPKPGQSETVTYLAQNTIATFKIKFTYEGDEKLRLAGRDVVTHRVREEPVGAKGVYTLWWYDDYGKGVKRFHKTTEHEYTYNLLAWR